MTKSEVKALKTHDHRKIHKDIYQIKSEETFIQQLPELKFISQRMTTSYNMDWDGRPEPIDEKWVAWKIVNQAKQYTRKYLDYKFKLMPPEIVWHEKDEYGRWIVDQMMLVDNRVTDEIFDWSIARVKKNLRVKALPEITFIKSGPALCAQRLHIGHYKDTQETLEEIKKDIETHGYRVKGARRDIYLLPAMGCYPADKCKTIVRVELEKL